MGFIVVVIVILLIGMGIVIFLNKKNYSDEELDVGKVVFVMGFCGVIEGVILFVLIDFVRVILLLVVGLIVVLMGGVDGIIMFLIVIVVGLIIIVLMVNYLKSMKRKKSNKLNNI